MYYTAAGHVIQVIWKFCLLTLWFEAYCIKYAHIQCKACISACFTVCIYQSTFSSQVGALHQLETVNMNKKSVGKFCRIQKPQRLHSLLKQPLMCYHHPNTSTSSFSMHRHNSKISCQDANPVFLWEGKLQTKMY